MTRVLTVTLNPAWDVTYEVPALVPGDVHRVRAAHRRPGGKGVNVAAVLHQLGVPVTATGLADADFDRAVATLGPTAAFVPALPHVRSTVAVVGDDATTGLWEPGPTPEDVEGAVAAIEERVGALLTDDAAPAVVVISGSLPDGVPDALPATLATLAHEHGVPAITDVSGAALAAAAAVPGVVLMPNADELAELLGRPCRDTAEVVAAGRNLVAKGARMVLATRGEDGLVLVTPDGAWLVDAPRRVRGNPTGAGDAAAAAVAAALARGDDPDHADRAARDAVALAAAAVAAPVAGRVDLDLFATLRTQTHARLWEGPR